MGARPTEDSKLRGEVKSNRDIITMTLRGRDYCDARLQERKWRLREAKQPAQSHPAGKLSTELALQKQVWAPT